MPSALSVLLLCAGAALAASTSTSTSIDAALVDDSGGSCDSCSCYGSSWHAQDDGFCYRKRKCCSSSHGGGGSSCSCGCLGSGWSKKGGQCEKRVCEYGSCHKEYKSCCGDDSHDDSHDDTPDTDCACKCYGSSWYEDEGSCYRKRQVGRARRPRRRGECRLRASSARPSRLRPTLRHLHPPTHPLSRHAPQCCHHDDSHDSCSCGCFGSSWRESGGVCTKQSCQDGHCETESKSCCSPA